MYAKKKEMFKKGYVLFTDGKVPFKYKEVNGNKLSTVRSGSFLTLQTQVFIQCDRYVKGLSFNHQIELADGRVLKIQEIEAIENNRKNMYKKDANIGMFLALG